MKRQTADKSAWRQIARQAWRVFQEVEFPAKPASKRGRRTTLHWYCEQVSVRREGSNALCKILNFVGAVVDNLSIKSGQNQLRAIL